MYIIEKSPTLKRGPYARDPSTKKLLPRSWLWRRKRFVLASFVDAETLAEAVDQQEQRLQECLKSMANHPAGSRYREIDRKQSAWEEAQLGVLKAAAAALPHWKAQPLPPPPKAEQKRDGSPLAGNDPVGRVSRVIGRLTEAEREQLLSML